MIIHYISSLYFSKVCSTHIATGACPYGRKCVFLHDPRLNGSQLVSTGRVKYIKGIANNKIVTKDCFYYPDQSKECSRKHTDDSTGIPTNDQQYNIPQSFRNKFASYHNKYLFSLWNHFIENINGSIAAVPTVTPSSIAISSPIGSSLPSNVVIPSSSIPYSNLRRYSLLLPLTSSYSRTHSLTQWL